MFGFGRKSPVLPASDVVWEGRSWHGVTWHLVVQAPEQQVGEPNDWNRTAICGYEVLDFGSGNPQPLDRETVRRSVEMSHAGYRVCGKCVEVADAVL